MNISSEKPILTIPNGNVHIEVAEEPNGWNYPGKIVVFENGIIAIRELFMTELVSSQLGSGVVKISSSENIDLPAGSLETGEASTVTFEVPGQEERRFDGDAEYYASGLVLIQDQSSRKKVTLLNASTGRVRIQA